MKKLIKQTLLTLAIVLGLMTLPSMSQTAYASGLNGNGQSSGSGTSQSTHGGPCKERTGFYVTVSHGSMNSTTAAGHGCILQTQGGYPIPPFAVASESRITGTSAGDYQLAPWPYPAFEAGTAKVGYGATIKNWLMAENGQGQTNAAAVAEIYCGVTPEQINSWIAAGECVFVNVEPIMFCKNWTSTKLTDGGGQIVGLTYGIGSQIPDCKTWISNVTRKAFPQSFRYDQNWQGISECDDPGWFELGVMTNKAIGCGIVSVMANESLQVVICVEDESGGWTTVYSGCGNEYDILQQYSGYDFVEATFSKKKTTLSDPHASYQAVCASGEPNRGVGVGHQVFNLDAGEEALFIHYKGENPPPPPEEALLYAHETAYPMPRMAAERADGTEVDHDFVLEDHILDVISEVSGWTKPCPHNGDYTCSWLTNVTMECVIDKVTCRDNEDWETEHYGVSFSSPKFYNQSWNLYREEVSGEEWDIFENALNNTDRWVINEVVDPQFSYYLTRSHLEDVSLSPDRTEGEQAFADALNIAPEFDWETSYTGKEGKSQQANTTGTHDVNTYHYEFTAYGYDLAIEYHYEHSDVSCQGHSCETCGGDGVVGSGDDATACTACSGTGTVYCDEKHDAHVDPENGTYLYTENSYTPDEWVGDTGESHKEEKYKTMLTPSGQSTAAGTIVDQKVGGALTGKFKGQSTQFNYTPITDQLVGSQFQGVTFTIYPEVAMSVWVVDDAASYIEPNEHLVYVMGERPRKYTPPIAHSYKTKIHNGTQMEGIGSLASAATGTAADDVNPYDLGVTAMGTTFEIATKTQYQMDIYTVGCTITDSEAHSEWGNEKTDVAASHEEYVASILGSMQQEILMKMDSTQFTDGPVWYTLLSTESKADRHDYAPEKTSVFWHKGDYDEAGTVQGWCNTMWGLGVDAYTGALQYTSSQILDTMFINCNDGPEENDSKPYSPGVHKGNPLGAGVIGNSAHWYDEESKDKMQVEFYHTRVIFGLQNADDKVDYNMLTQSAKSRLIKQSDNIHVSFYSRLFNDQNFTAADGYMWEGHTGTYRVDQIKKIDFSVLNQTTSQMKK